MPNSRSSAHRLLGFAFASADLLMEVNRKGQINFAVGAGETLSGLGDRNLVGANWREFVADADHPMVAALFDGLENGRRAGPVTVRLQARDDGKPRALSLSALRLQQNGDGISCAMSAADPDSVPTGASLQSREAFESIASTLLQTAKNGGPELELTFVELAGLSAVRATSDLQTREALDTRLSGVLRSQSFEGSAAAELGDDRFALVRRSGEAPASLARRMDRLLKTAANGQISSNAAGVALKGPNGPKQMARALRYTLDSFLRDGFESELPSNLDDALSRALEKTLDEVGALGAAIRDKDFRLVYQPVVRLRDGTAHHYEVLVRFGKDQSPFPMIRMAEEMELIEQLDLAILDSTIKTLIAWPNVKLAVNISGRTIASESFITQALKMIKPEPDIRGRLLFELTESAAIEDLAAADLRLDALRMAGCEICLDDFGAGAASLAYLQQLRLDVLKIDGRYIRDLQHGGREATFVKHLVKMCNELGVRTLAEMIETAAVEDVCQRAGVDLGQGWLYGAAGDEPVYKIPQAKIGLRPGLRSAR